MSGHSKWAQIKRQKTASDEKKGALFSRLTKAITLASKEGGPDPEKNFKLRLTIDKARASNMPQDNIERAIKKGTGSLEGEKIEEIYYEGYAPGGIALILQVLTDNKNRATSEIRGILNEFGGRLGERNSVRWLFEEKGVIKISEIKNKEKLELTAIESGAEDIKENKEEITIITKKEDLQKIKNQIEKRAPVAYAEIEMIPKNLIFVQDPKTRNQLEKLMEKLDESEKINNYFTNLEEE